MGRLDSMAVVRLQAGAISRQFDGAGGRMNDHRRARSSRLATTAHDGLGSGQTPRTAKRWADADDSRRKKTGMTARIMPHIVPQTETPGHTNPTVTAGAGAADCGIRRGYLPRI